MKRFVLHDFCSYYVSDICFTHAYILFEFCKSENVVYFWAHRACCYLWPFATIFLEDTKWCRVTRSGKQTCAYFNAMCHSMWSIIIYSDGCSGSTRVTVVTHRLFSLCIWQATFFIYVLRSCLRINLWSKIKEAISCRVCALSLIFSFSLNRQPPTATIQKKTEMHLTAHHTPVKPVRKPGVWEELCIYVVMSFKPSTRPSKP